MNDKVTLKIGDSRGKGFIAAWHAAENCTARERREIAFESLEGLLSALTPQRLRLLRTLHERGRISIRRLSFALERDYSSVHGDVKALAAAGLIERGKGGISVPYERISAEVDLAA